MSRWFSNDDAYGTVVDLDTYKGTLCIGAIVIAQSGERLEYNEKKQLARLLGVPVDDLDSLVYLCGWTDELRLRYADANTNKTRARVAIAATHSFIQEMRETHGCPRRIKAQIGQ
jgi:hypothetical protein